MIAYSNRNSLIDAIRTQITSNDAQAIKAMLRIYEYQTEAEKINEDVNTFNGVGFVGTDAYILSEFCKQYQKKGSLSEKQMVIVRKKIGKYARQIVMHAIERGIYAKVDGKWIIANK